MEVDYQAILIAIISGGVGGAIITLFKPLVDWNIEKRRKRRKERKQMLNKVKEMLDKLVDMDDSSFSLSTELSIFLRGALNKKERKKLGKVIYDLDSNQIKSDTTEADKKKIRELRQIGLQMIKGLHMQAIQRYERKYL